jgi:hypothetical protein
LSLRVKTIEDVFIYTHIESTDEIFKINVKLTDSIEFVKGKIEE